MRLEDLPVVDARLPGRPGIRQHKTTVEFLSRHEYGLVVDSVRPQVNGAHAAIQRRIVVLASGGHANQLGLDVLRDLANLLEIQVPAGEARQRGGGGNHQRR